MEGFLQRKASRYQTASQEAQYIQCNGRCSAGSVLDPAQCKRRHSQGAIG